MPRRKKPIAVQELKGAYKKDPQRRPVNNISDERVLSAEPPSYLSKLQKEIWREVIRMQPVDGLFRGADAYSVELLTRLIHKMRIGKASSADLGRLHMMLGDFGMTPSGRAKLSDTYGGAKKQEENPWEDL